MSVNCYVKIAGDYALINAEESKHRVLRFDLSKSYSQCYENTREQSKSYVEEIVHWLGEKPKNLEFVLKSLMMHLFVRRKEMGLVA